MWCMGCTSDIQAACDTWNSVKSQASGNWPSLIIAGESKL